MSDGMCLTHAFEKMKDYSNEGKNVLYVQATVTNHHTNKTFEHAWVELPDSNMVIDPTIDVKIPKDEYYDLYTPKNIIKISDPFLLMILCKRNQIKFFTKSEVEEAKEHIAMLDAKYPRKDLKNDRKKKIIKPKSKRKVCRCKNEKR